VLKIGNWWQPNRAITIVVFGEHTHQVLLSAVPGECCTHATNVITDAT